MDGRTNGWKISPFYRTSYPIGAAALPPTMKTKEKVKQGKGSADHLMPLGYLFKFAWQAGWLGLSPGWLGLRPGWLGLSPGWLGLRPGWLGLRPGWLGLRPG